MMQYLQHMAVQPVRHLQIYAHIQAVAEHGSIRKASEFLRISPSALNRQILGFERDIGVQLFERLPVGVRLSAAGEIYYRHIIDHIAAIEGAAETVVALKGARYGHITIAASAELVASFLAQQIARFRATHAGVRFTILPCGADDHAEVLESRAADLALVLQPVHHAQANTLAMAETQAVAIVPAPVIASHVRWEAIADHDLILPPEGSGLRERLDLEFRHRSVPAEPMIESAQLIAPSRGVRRTMQFWPAWDVSAAWLSAHNAAQLPFARRLALRVGLLSARGRVLPVAAERFAMQLAARLQSEDRDL